MPKRNHTSFAFFRILLVVVFLGGFLGDLVGQVTIAVQDFESTPATPTWGYNNVGNVSTGNGDFPPDPKFVSGSRGCEANDGNVILEFDAVNTSAYTANELSFRLASFSQSSSSNGADAGDVVLVSVSDDNGVTWSEELEVTGNTNARWSFTSGVGIASSSYDGNNTPYTINPAGGGDRTTDGYSFIEINDLPSVPNLKVKIQLLNNQANELWVIDDVKLSGILAVTTTIVNFNQATYTQTEDGASIDLCIAITNPDANATSADVVLTSGMASDLGSYTTQTVTFPANTSTQQCVTITISGNAICDGNMDYIFELQNVSGGNSAAAGSQNSTVLTVTDDEQFSGTIAFQGFEGSGWNYTEYPTVYNVGNNVWDTVPSLSTILPSLGSYFWGVQDLNNSNGGGNFDHTLTFSNLLTTGYNNLSLSFDYYTIGFESGDKLQYKIALNGGVFGTSTDLLDNTGNSWVTESISIPDGTTSIQLQLIGNQNGTSDYAGWDNIKLTGVGCFTCSEPTTQSTFFAASPSFPDETSATFNWTVAGNGQNRLVVLHQGSSVTTDPVDGASYPANTSFGTPGTDIGSGEYAVYNGPNHTATITNLIPGTEYFAKLFEYNCLPGSEDYLTSGNPDTDVFITPPENPASFDEGCVGPTSMGLSWTPPANGNNNGYLLVVREGSNPPVAVTNLDPATQIFSTDFTSAPVYGSGSPVSKVLYRGSATSVTITNLTANSDYTFEVFTYVAASSGHKYSDGTTTSQNIHIEDVTNLVTTPHANTIEFSWAVDPSCVDEIILAASGTSAVTSTPSGNGYTVNSNLFTDGSNPTLSPGGEKVVYSGTGTSVTISGLTTDQEYCFKVFVRKGAVWSQGVAICETPRTNTILEPGDISIVAINTDTNIGYPGSDEVCFLSYKSITANTAIDLTDNGYERDFPGKWGDTEGVIRIKRKPTAPTIPAGQVICIEGKGYQPGNFTIYTCGVADTDWEVSSLNGNYSFDLNGQDQVWILQNGNWLSSSGNQNADYTGNILYGWTALGWEPSAGYHNTSGSTLFPNSFCLSTNLNTIANGDKVKYTGSIISNQSRIAWIEAFNDISNWTGYSSNSAYFNASPDYGGTCIQITINAVISTAGLWTGSDDNDWFNCKNWDNLRLPDETVNATIGNVSNDPVIDGPGAACYDLTIEPDAVLTMNDASADLSIYGDLFLQGTLTNSDGNVIFAGNADQNISDSTATVQNINFENLTVNKPSGKLSTDENLTITSNAQFDSGILELDPASTLTFQSGATTTGASNASYVDGKVIKTGISEDFTFPIGDIKGDTAFWYQPARIFGYGGNTTIEAQYFAEAHPHAGAYYDGESNTPGDNQEIGNCDYWTVNKNSGVDVKLALTFTNSDSEYCNEVGQPAYLRIYSFDATATEWNEVASGNMGNEIESNVSIGTAVTGGDYGDFAFGTVTQSNLNVLPIALLSFTAEAKANMVQTRWTTASETNNAFFTVERSADAKFFEPIGRVYGAGTSHVPQSYTFDDRAPLSGISYYRLKQTDFDGNSTYSEVRSVEFYKYGKFSLDMAYRKEAQLILVYTADAPDITVEIFDVFGQLVFGSIVENDAGRSVINPHLNRGVYLVQISQSGQHASLKFFW